MIFLLQVDTDMLCFQICCQKCLWILPTVKVGWQGYGAYYCLQLPAVCPIPLAVLRCLTQGNGVDNGSFKDAKWNKVVLCWVTASHDSSLFPSASFLLLLLQRPFKSSGHFNLLLLLSAVRALLWLLTLLTFFAFKAAVLAQAILCVLLLHESALWLFTGGLALTHISFQQHPVQLVLYDRWRSLLSSSWGVET